MINWVKVKDKKPSTLEKVLYSTVNENNEYSTVLHTWIYYPYADDRSKSKDYYEFYDKDRCIRRPCKCDDVWSEINKP